MTCCRLHACIFLELCCFHSAADDEQLKPFTRVFTHTVPVVRNLSDEVVLPPESVSWTGVESRYVSRVSSPIDKHNNTDSFKHHSPATDSYAQKQMKSVSFSGEAIGDRKLTHSVISKPKPTCSVQNVEFDASLNEYEEQLLRDESSDSVAAMLKTGRSFDAFHNPYSSGREPTSGGSALARQWRVPKHNRSVYRLAYSADRSLRSARSTSYIDELTWRASTSHRDHSGASRPVHRTPRRIVKSRCSSTSAVSAKEQLELANSLPARERKASLARVAYSSVSPAPTIMLFQPPKPRSGLRRGNDAARDLLYASRHEASAHCIDSAHATLLPLTMSSRLAVVVFPDSYSV